MGNSSQQANQPQMGTVMCCVVRKYGGACFANQERLLRVAEQIVNAPVPVVVVVSARQGVTDLLTAQMSDVGSAMATAARDLLLATGELQSAALLAAAIEQAGGLAEVIPPWIVFRTDGVFGNASIRGVNIDPIQECLDCGVTPIVPGFIGATEVGQITTLGRGGSDYSAVALGAALDASRVELCKAEVDGVYDADPNGNSRAQRFETLTHAQALCLARAGAKVLQDKAADLANRTGIPVVVRSAFGAGRGTRIGAAECETVVELVC
jgi:aspartate kinase